MDLQDNFLRYERNKVTLNSFLTHDFDGAIVFISVNSEVKCNSTDVTEEDITSSFLAYQRVLGGIYKVSRVDTSLKLSLN